MHSLRTFHSALVPVLSFSLLFNLSMAAQTPVAAVSATRSPEAEARLRLQSAHTLFIQDDGEDDAFPARDTNAYIRFVTSIDNWGRYRVVNNIKDADLVLQFRAAATTTVVNNSADDPGTSIYHRPYLKLVLAAPDTLQPLWTITVPVLSGKHHGQDLFDLTVANATSQLKLLDGLALTRQEQAGIDYVHIKHRHQVFLAVGGAALIVGGAVSAGVIMKNNFDATAARNKQAQLDFCKQNNIPNCAA